MKEYFPLILILGFVIMVISGMWWALNPAKPKKSELCPRCREPRIKRVGWNKVKRVKTPWYGRRRGLHVGLRFDTQKVFYKCDVCQYEWDQEELVPTIGSL